jgi:hypothetical protein
MATNGKSFICLILTVFFLTGCKGSGSTVLPVPYTRTGSERIAETMTSAAPTAPPQPPSTPVLLPTRTKQRTLDSSPTAGRDPGPFRLVRVVEEILPGSFVSLSADADGTLWLVTDTAVARGKDADMTVYLPGYSGTFVGVDQEERVWVTDEDFSQISAWNGETWSTYGMDEGWLPLDDGYSQYVSGGQSDPSGRVWFATSQDIRVFDGGRWMAYTPQELGMESLLNEEMDHVFYVTVLPNGMVWVGECDWSGPGPFGGGGVRWLDGQTWRGVSSAGASGCATGIVHDGLGRVWAGLDDNLWRYDPASDVWSKHPFPESPVAGMRFRFAHSLAVDPHEEVWPMLALCGGGSCYGDVVLYHLQEDAWNQIGSTAEYDYYYWGPVFDSTGAAWLRWEEGILRINNDAPEVVSSLPAVSGSRDAFGRIWIVAPYENRLALWLLEDMTNPK